MGTKAQVENLMRPQDHRGWFQAFCSNLIHGNQTRTRTAPMDRIVMLNEILAQNPTDAFARYGLAMEYSKTGEVEQAMKEFAELLSAHPDYCAGYFMAAQTLAKAERADEAKKM